MATRDVDAGDRRAGASIVEASTRVGYRILGPDRGVQGYALP
jgi:hypothetical protein